MILHCDDAPAVEVDDATFKRFLRFPPTREFEDTLADNAQWARDWFAENAHPWVIALEANEAIRELVPEISAAASDSVAVVVASAGPEAEQHAAERWDKDEPDRYYFLECLAAAVVDHLLTRTRNAFGTSRHVSPGYPNWGIEANHPLLASIKSTVDLPGPLDVLSSGMLMPKKSQIAVFAHEVLPTSFTR